MKRAHVSDPASPQHNVMSIADSQIVEKLEEKSRNIMVQETLRQDISMVFSLKLNKNFNDMSYKSGKSLLVELIFGVSKRAEGRQKPRRLLLMIQNNSNFGKSFHNHSSKSMQICSTFLTPCPLKLCHVKSHCNI